MNIFFNLFELIKIKLGSLCDTIAHACEDRIYDCGCFLLDENKALKIKKILYLEQFYCNKCEREKKEHKLNLVNEHRLIKEEKVTLNMLSLPGKQIYEKNETLLPIENRIIYIYECSECGSKAYSEKKF